MKRSPDRLPDEPRTATTQLTGGRANQKQRTRCAIIDAAARLMRSGREVSMLEVATAALVSEATAYRYFPDLATLISDAMADQMPSPQEALASVAHSRDPVERIAVAAEQLMRHVLAFEGATRAMIGATITRPTSAGLRPGLRFGLIDYALEPLADGPSALAPEALAQLKNDLAVVIGAEALFTLTDLCGLAPEEAIASAVHTATVITRAALSEAVDSGAVHSYRA